LLGDKLSKNLPDFKLHKIVKQPSEWDVCISYLIETINDYSNEAYQNYDNNELTIY